jgi:hypothetical protein
MSTIVGATRADRSHDWSTIFDRNGVQKGQPNSFGGLTVALGKQFFAHMQIRAPAFIPTKGSAEPPGGGRVILGNLTGRRPGWTAS